jgi:cytochrome c peroxidase
MIRPPAPTPTLRSGARLGLAAACLLAVLAACSKKEPSGTEQAPPARAPGEIDQAALKAFAPLPDVMASSSNPITEDKITLGRALFFEKRLSAANDLSCNSCHDLSSSGADTRGVSLGHKKQAGSRNSPTVFNAAGHLAQFWDGRAPTVEEQAKGPITNPVEMAMESPAQVLTELRRTPWYVEQFKKAFPGEADPVTFDNLGRAVGAFERKLVTPSRWDKFLKGDKAALTDAEKAGFAKFAETGCTSCHNGAYVGGSMYQKLGLVAPWPDQKDLGRFAVTKQEADKMFFKVPSLRNIEKTAPYFHDGSVATLPEAVKLMAKHQLGKQLSDADTASIVTWLKSLSGSPPSAYVTEFKVPGAPAASASASAAGAAPRKPGK